MSLCLRPFQDLTTTFHILLLSKISLVLALPASNDRRVGYIDTRAIAAPDLSGAAGTIGGAAFGLIVLSVGFGLGAASIAILGSIEWREFRDRKKPEVPSKDANGFTPQQAHGEKSVDRVDTGLSESTVNDKEKQIEASARRERSRLTLKTFMPIDLSKLKPGWLKVTKKT